MKVRSEDTIAAIATPRGEGAIAIVRISGPDSIDIADRVFRGKVFLRDVDGYTVHYGELRDQTENLVDIVLVTVFRTPHSYTGEDSIEFSCHGGVIVTNLVLEALLEAGARQADPGEFTMRAYLNGKLDLSQAEAVADLISARSRKACNISMGQLKGKLTETLVPLRKSILEACSLLELELDFSADNIPLIPKDQIEATLSDVEKRVESLLRTYGLGKAYREGVSVVLAGRPNVGKSSIFNRILMNDRAIVAPTPGTTRDFIEESTIIDGIPFRIVDTAGLRSTDDLVEASGISKTMNLLKETDLVLEIFDTCEAVVSEERSLIVMGQTVHRVRVFNKIDLMDVNRVEDLRASFTPQDSCVFVSALNGNGIEDLRRAMVDSISRSGVNLEEGPQVTSKRHEQSLANCLKSIERARESNLIGEPSEFTSFELRQAADALSVIVGEITTDDILDSIFGKFCIGK